MRRCVAGPGPVVTVIEPTQTFYRAEDYHQRYLEKQGRSSCTPALRETIKA
jgi:peptide methionine sulfoxide reductase MsrA